MIFSGLLLLKSLYITHDIIDSILGLQKVRAVQPKGFLFYKDEK